MKFTRRCGILLHPTSLPGTPGIGTIGKPAFNFVDWLTDAGQSLWQILPLGPTGYGDSPYASFSTFAGNPLLIDLDLLVQSGWLSKKDIRPQEYIKSAGNVDFGAVVWWKLPLLKKAALNFLKGAEGEALENYKAFCRAKKSWLEDYALFMSIKTVYDKKAAEEKPANSIWYAWWPKKLALHDPEALKEWYKANKQDVETYKVIQFFFEQQWSSLKKYANENGISLIGDIPIFVAPDSADVWSNQSLFQLGRDGKPNCVAGVPPDYFCADGQLWGNPLYDWKKMKDDGYKWWIARIKRVFELTDVLRIDHFRGFEAYWSVPATEKTAKNGKWCPGPGYDLFKTIKSKLGDVPVIAEDLGVITDEVRDLRDKCGFPGMKVLQFAFSPEEAKQNGMVNYFLPHMYNTDNCVAYTGTHDNDTLQGWLENLNDEQLLLVSQYIEGCELDVKKARSLVSTGKLRKAMIRAVVASSAAYAIVPMQDITGADNSARMNTPATTGTNWTWRMNAKDLRSQDAAWLSFITSLYGRDN